MRKKSEDRKSEIVEVALRLADTHGPDRLSTDDIAREVGISQPGIFRHFPKKQDIWVGVAKFIGERMQHMWKSLGTEHDSHLDHIHSLLVGQLGLVEKTPAIPAILFSRELHVENAALRSIIFSLMAMFQTRLKALLIEAQKAGEISDQLDEKHVAMALISLVQGLAIRWSISGRGFGLQEEGTRLIEMQLNLLKSSKTGGTS